MTGRRGCHSGACDVRVKELGRGSEEAQLCPGLAPQELVPEGLRPEGVERGWEHRIPPGAGVTRRREGGLEHLSQGNGRSLLEGVKAWYSWQWLLQWWGPSGGVGCGSRRARPEQAWGTPAPHLPPASLVSVHLSFTVVSPAGDAWASIPGPFVPGRCPQPLSAPSWGLQGHQAWAWL